MSLKILKWGLPVLIILAVPFFQPLKLIDIPPSFRVVEKTVVSLPFKILIPNIEVTAAIEPVQLTHDGLMDVPKEPQNTSWYSLGTIPGEIGSAVIAGHVDGPDNSPAVFHNLHTLKPGDKVEIENYEGKLISFLVTHTKSFDPKADASEVFASSDGQAHLNLITCSGTWDENLEDYSERLVVFTTKEY